MGSSLEQLNTGSEREFVAALQGIYEHSPWIAERAASARPFASVAALKHRLQQVVQESGHELQLGLIRAHPELAGKAALAGELTRESTSEQARAGLDCCSAEEYARLQQLNRDYNAKFGFPFILAVKGPDGQGLSRPQIIAAFTRRLQASVASEMAECLYQIGRIAELRLNDLLAVRLPFGDVIMQRAKVLAALSEQAEDLTCSYLTLPHRQCAAQLADWMRAAGLAVQIDAVGNVRGRYVSRHPGAKTLLTGSHYDTVRQAGWYDGRLGILLPLMVLQHLHEAAVALPFHVELIAFSEEEGVRFQSTFLGSRALLGQFGPELLALRDADGISMEQALREAGHDPADIPSLALDSALDPAQLCGFIEVHIEQGPVLLQQNLPLGVVSAIAGSSRFWLHLTGEANHAGTTPMTMRHDAVAAAAEVVLMLERRCGAVAGLVGTTGQVQVPQGAMNVVAGECRITLDIRAADDAVRLAAVEDIKQAIAHIAAERGVQWRLEPVLQTAAVPCNAALQGDLAQAIGALGLPVCYLPSGAGHDAMMMAQITPMSMLFVRCGNRGISHNRLETMTADDAELAAQVFLTYLLNQAMNKALAPAVQP